MASVEFSRYFQVNPYASFTIHNSEHVQQYSINGKHYWISHAICSIRFCIHAVTPSVLCSPGSCVWRFYDRSYIKDIRGMGCA